MKERPHFSHWTSSDVLQMFRNVYIPSLFKHRLTDWLMEIFPQQTITQVCHMICKFSLYGQSSKRCFDIESCRKALEVKWRWWRCSWRGLDSFCVLFIEFKLWSPCSRRPASLGSVLRAEQTCVNWWTSDWDAQSRSMWFSAGCKLGLLLCYQEPFMSTGARALDWV